MAVHQPGGRDDMLRHDKWLCMMCPRLVLLRELMSGAGSIEVIGATGVLVCDLVFDTAWTGSLNARHFH